jgi:hypothetical protein
MSVICRFIALGSMCACSSLFYPKDKEYTGHELLSEMRIRSPMGNTNTSQSVYVPADNASAVDAHLKAR